MTGRDRSARAAHQLYQRIARLNCRGSGAGLIVPAGAVHFPRSDAGDPQVRTFRAPDRTVTIPDVGRCAGECLSGGDDGGGKQGEYHMATLERPSEPENPPDDIERPLLESAPARIGRVVAQNRSALALRFEGNPLDAQHVVHSQDIDSVS